MTIIDSTPRGRPRITRDTVSVSFKALVEDDAAVRETAVARGVEMSPVLREVLHLGLSVRLPLARAIWAMRPEVSPDDPPLREGPAPALPQAAEDLFDLYAVAVLGWPRREFRPACDPTSAQHQFQQKADAQEAAERAEKAWAALYEDLGLPPLLTDAQAWARFDDISLGRVVP